MLYYSIQHHQISDAGSVSSNAILCQRMSTKPRESGNARGAWLCGSKKKHVSIEPATYMMMSVALVLLANLALSFAYDAQFVHLSVNVDPTSITISWLTTDSSIAGFPTVEYGRAENALRLALDGQSVPLDFAKSEALPHPVVHTVTLVNLEPDTQYFYRVGHSTFGWSPVYSFHTGPAFLAPQVPINIVAYGDMGVFPTAQRVVNYVHRYSKELTELNERVNFILHAGDLVSQM